MVRNELDRTEKGAKVGTLAALREPGPSALAISAHAWPTLVRFIREALCPEEQQPALSEENTIPERGWRRLCGERIRTELRFWSRSLSMQHQLSIQKVTDHTFRAYIEANTEYCF